jgi:hypothetical protein
LALSVALMSIMSVEGVPVDSDIAVVDTPDNREHPSFLRPAMQLWDEVSPAPPLASILVTLAVRLDQTLVKEMEQRLDRVSDSTSPEYAKQCALVLVVSGTTIPLVVWCGLPRCQISHGLPGWQEYAQATRTHVEHHTPAKTSLRLV